MKVLLFLILMLLIAAVGGFVYTYSRWEGDAPAVTLDRDFKALGNRPALTLKVDDTGTGLRQITIHLKQKDQDVVLADESFERGTAEKAKQYDLGKLIAEKTKIQDGPATLTV